MNKAWWRPVRNIAAFLLFNIFLVCTSLAAYIQWAEWSGKDVIDLLYENRIVRKVFIEKECVDLVLAVQADRKSKFVTKWDFDQGVALSKSMFAEQEMFGQLKYKYRPDIEIYNLVAWSGLRKVPLAFASNPRVKNALKKVKLIHNIQFKTDQYGFKKIQSKVGPGSPTILFLGDSFTEGLWVAPADTFSNLVGLKLNSSGVEITPLNLGVNGYSTLEMDWMLEQHAHSFDAKMVVVNLFANDVHVDYLQVLKGFGIPEENYEEMFHYLQRMKDFCGLKDITLFVAVIPAKEQFDQYHELSFFNNRIKTWCRKEYIQYLDPRDYFVSVGLDNIYFSWDPHLSPHGHEVYANYLYEHIISCFN